MYLKQLEIKNIRSIGHFTMEFDKPAGWHVLIGDNGAGKSSVIRSIALALVGPDEIMGITPDWNEWLKWNEEKGKIRVEILKEKDIDKQTTKIETTSKFSGIGSSFPIELNFSKETKTFVELRLRSSINAKSSIWASDTGWFSAGFGPFRRFTGGAHEKGSIFKNPRLQRLAAHLSLFGEDVALTEAMEWLINLQFQTLEKKVAHNLLEDLKRLINSPEFLPHKAQLSSISSDGVIFIDGNGAKISVTQMSDGYRSILSLTFELLRQLIRVYGSDKVFKHVKNENWKIDLPGIVLIDEVDAHLHPTWQTRIGQWFTKYFPNIQFIVTTHSPLVCRACENGSIWRLAAPGSESESGEVKGDDRNRLIFGNVLDAYGTEIFGKAITISKEANDKRTLLGEMNIKSIMGEEVDEEKMAELKTIFPTEKLEQRD